MKLTMKGLSIAVGTIAASAIIILIAGGFLFDFFETTDTERLEEQLQEKKAEIDALKSDNLEYVLKNTRLEADVARLNASQPGGAAVQEKSKALTERETKLKIKEGRLSRREEQLQLAEDKVDKLQADFYAETGLTMVEIGQAKEIKETAKQLREDYEDMRTSRDRAEERANNWLVYFSIVSILFLACIVGMTFFLMNIAAKDRRVDGLVRLVDSMNLSVQNKKLLMASLGGHLIDHPRDEGPRDEGEVDLRSPG